LLGEKPSLLLSSAYSAFLCDLCVELFSAAGRL